MAIQSSGSWRTHNHQGERFVHIHHDIEKYVEPVRHDYTVAIVTKQPALKWVLVAILLFLLGLFGGYMAHAQVGGVGGQGGGSASKPNSGASLANGTSVKLAKTCISSDTNCYTVNDDVQVAMTATYTSGGSTITTGSTDPIFTAADVGKKFLATTACDQQNGYVNCFQSFPAGTITGYTSAHIVTVSSAASRTSSVNDQAFTGWFEWGHDDGVQVAAAYTYALTKPGMTLYLPCGSMFIGQAPFLSTSTGATYNPNIIGCASSGTVLIPTADFTYTSASHAFIYYYPSTNQAGFQGGSCPLCYQNPFYYSQLRDFTIWGGGVDGSAVTTALPMFLLYNTDVRNVAVVGWLWHSGAAMNTTPVFSAQSLVADNIYGWGAGSGGLSITGNQSPSEVPSHISNCFFGAQAGTAGPTSGYSFQISNTANVPYVETDSCDFNPGVTGSTTPAANMTAGFWTSRNDQIGGIGVSGGHVQLYGTQDAILKSYGLNITGGTVSAQDSQIDYLNMTAGSFEDKGGNYACSTVNNYYPCLGTISPWTSNIHSLNSITGGTLIQQASGIGLSAPTMAPGTGAGTSPTCTSVTGNNFSGVVSCSTGTAPSASATLATLTFNGGLAAPPLGCTITPRNAASASALVYTTAPSTSAWTIAVAGTALTGSTPYSWSYNCPQWVSTAVAYQDFAGFVGTAGTAISSYTTVAPGSGKTFTLFSNDTQATVIPKLTGSGSISVPTGSDSTFGNSLDTLTPATANYTVGITCTNVAGTPDMGVIARAISTSNTQYDASLTNGQITFFKEVSNTFTQFGSNIATSWTTGATLTLSITVNGTTISVAVNGTTVGSTTDSSLSAAGQGGFRITGGGDVACTNFYMQ